MKSRRRFALTIGLLALLASSSARADDKQACVDAYSQAQTLRDAHKLLAGREQLRICARTSCSEFITKDCTTWLADVEARIPSVVLLAKDGAGNVQTDVRVAMDGTVIAEKLDGRSIDADPGPHTFTFVTGDGTKVELPFLVAEGQKDQRVSVTLGPAPAPTPAVPASTTPADLGPATPVATDSGAGSGSSMRTIGLIVGGAGVVGLVAGSILGAQAISKWSSAQSECQSATSCANHGQALQDKSDASSAATLSTVSFVVGGLAVAGGAALFLLAPSAGSANTPSVGISPSVGRDGAGMVMRGVF